MSQDISFSRFVYPDTNILGMLAEDLTMWRPLQDFLYRHDLCVAISAAQVAELSEARTLHANLNTLLTAVPSVLIKPPDRILDEEVRSYPHRRTDALVLYYLNALFGKQDFAQFLSSPELAEARRQQKITAKQMRRRFNALKPNFPPSESGKYIWEQAEDFAWINTVQWLADTHLPFLQRFKDKAPDLNAEVFLSVQLFGYAIFYKHYLHGKQPELTDFGDMFHLFAIPYCKLAILERDMSNVLNHIKSHHRVLDGVVVKNVDFFHDWMWDEEQ